MQGEVEIFLAASYETGISSGLMGHLAYYAAFTFFENLESLVMP